MEATNVTDIATPLSLETPQLRAARMPDRMFAAVFDTILCFPILMTIASIFVRSYHVPVAAYGSWKMEGGPALGSIVADVAFLCIYCFVFEAWRGTTFGKEIMGIEVRSSAGGHCGLGRSFLRNLLRPIDAIGFYLLGFLVAILSPFNRRIGDRVAGTVVTQNPHARRWRAFFLWLVTTGVLVYIASRLIGVLLKRAS